MFTLPSWKEGPTKQSILDFLNRVTKQDSNDYILTEDRIAVFDNDGTLWCEKPLPIQLDFLLSHLKEKALSNPSLQKDQPWKAVIHNDYSWLSNVISKHYQGDDHDLKEMAGALLNVFNGLTVDQFKVDATSFLQNSMHPLLKRPYLRCAYKPMIELLQLLKRSGFQNYVASGGGRDFMRPITQDLYGVSPDHVIGSSVALEYRDDGEVGEIILKPEAEIFNDGPEKPVRIWSRIGRRPVFSAGNSNGDIPMLRFCYHPSRPSFGLLIHHDDSEREFAYQTGAERALALAEKHRWTIASIKNDWKAVFEDSVQVNNAA